jgi:hypothetical protein
MCRSLFAFGFLAAANAAVITAAHIEPIAAEPFAPSSIAAAAEFRRVSPSRVEEMR